MRGRIQSLEAARGVAALMVVAVHVHSFHTIDRRPQADWLGFTVYGWLGVQVFFVLSGLVLYLPYASGRPLHLRDYARARVTRIVPALWAVIVLSATVLGMWSWSTVRHALFVNADAAYAHSPVPQAWSITVEMGFYLLLPLLVWLFAARPVLRVPILAGLILAGCVCRALTYHGWPVTPLAFVDNFAVGVLAAICVARIPRHRAMLFGAAFAFAAALTLIPVTRWASMFALLIVCGLFAAGLAAVAAVDPHTPRALVFVGTVSYGVFLWHWPILIVATDHGLYRLPDGLEILLVAAASIVVGWASWKLIEQPALAYGRRSRTIRRARGAGRDAGNRRPRPLATGHPPV
jgi:peptidoglycan/LPS O-acetylase OafA/YrhL